MTMQSNIIRIIYLFSILALHTSNSLSKETEKTPYDFEAQSQTVFPERDTHYNLPEIRREFKDILRPKVLEKFDAYFGILFEHAFPPKHPPEAVATGYQCLWSKIMAANTHEDPKKILELQMTALYESIGFHKALITKYNKTLADEIPKLSICKNCVMNFKTKPHETKAYTTGAQP